MQERYKKSLELHNMLPTLYVFGIWFIEFNFIVDKKYKLLSADMLEGSKTINIIKYDFFI